MKIVLTVVEATYLPDLQPLVLPLLINGAHYLVICTNSDYSHHGCAGYILFLSAGNP